MAAAYEAVAALASSSLTRLLTSLPSARPLTLGMSCAHDLAHVTGRAGAGGGDGLDHEGADLVLPQLLGQVGREDVDLGLLLVREVIATGVTEGLDRFAARLDLLGDDRQRLLVGERLALVLGGILGSSDHHAQGVASVRVAIAHGGLHVSLELFGKAHGGPPLIGQVEGARTLGSRTGSDGRAYSPRAAFFRFASLRFRLTLGFSKCSRRRASARMPLCWIFLLKRRRAASKVSFSPTRTSAN